MDEPLPAKDDILRFQPFSSAVTVEFWKELARRKLETYKLDESPKSICGWFTPSAKDDGRIPSRFILDQHSFGDDDNLDDGAVSIRPQTNGIVVNGCLKNFNTIEDFKDFDKAAALNQLSSQIWKSIYSGSAVEYPEELLPFFLLSYVDLKKHTFLYWFCFPALAAPRPFRAVAGAPRTLGAAWGPRARRALAAGVARLRRNDGGNTPFFLVIWPLLTSEDEYHIPGQVDERAERRQRVRVLPLSAWEDAGALTREEKARTVFAFMDPCPLQQYPGWPLRNFLVLLSARWGLAEATILAYRAPLRRLSRWDRDRELSASTLRSSQDETATVASSAPGSEGGGGGGSDGGEGAYVAVPSPAEEEAVARSLLFEVDLSGGPRCPHAPLPMPPPPGAPVGWELNKNGKPGPRLVDLGALMDPTRLAAQAADLNIKLMKWRALPALDTDRLANLRCLLLGAGTLGCSVARNLMAWGVRHLDVVDNGRVSYSNPVRQPLFELEDCKAGGKPKAEAACEALRRIFPGMNATPHSFTIPMPGHAVGGGAATEAAEAAFWRLAGLFPAKREISSLLCAVVGEARVLEVENADVIFTLTDTRESRWLPSLLAADKDKTLINVSLGMDSYLVLRQGSGVPRDDGVPREDIRLYYGLPNERLGCYFCNDVVGPDNSTHRRALDQQCTVTRPGCAPAAAAAAVELMVGLIHAPEGHHAPAAEGSADLTGAPPDPAARPLGGLPHQVRGFLARFAQIAVRAPAFDRCTACSPAAVGQLRDLGFAFVLQACNGPGYLEQLTGLDALQQGVEDIDIEWDEDDDLKEGGDCSEECRRGEQNLPVIPGKEESSVEKGGRTSVGEIVQSLENRDNMEKSNEVNDSVAQRERKSSQPIFSMGSQLR